MSSWDRMQIREPHAGRAIGAGLIATSVLTGLMYLGPVMGVRTWNIPAMVGGAMSFNEMVTPSLTPGPYGVGFLLFVIFGVLVFPACYAYWMYSYLPAPDWMRGITYGGILWLLVEIFLMPLIGQGPFDAHGPNTAVEIFSQLVLWLIYGFVLAVISGPQQVWRRQPHPRPEQHA